MDTTPCPECGTIAEVLWREVMVSTEGPFEHAKFWCGPRHWFLLPVAWLERAPPRSQPTAVRTR